VVAISGGPGGLNGVGQVAGGGEAAASLTIGSDEVGVAELADGAGAVAFPARPQVAAGEAAKDGRSSCVAAFPL
jgi:hypothetical protein